jgi:hypothetical protein
MAADEIQAAIDRASEKRREIQEQQQIAGPSARMFTMLPRAALKARSILRELFGGKIRLVPQLDGGLVAHWNLHPGALLRA